MTWRMYAHDFSGKPYHVCAKREIVSLYGAGAVWPVTATEVDENPTHWGWLPSDHPAGPPHMIWPSRGQLEMCFPYGMQAEIDRGRGHMVELNITFVEEEPR